MKKLFISQQMSGLSEDEILKTKDEIKARAEQYIGEHVELVNSNVEEYPVENSKQVSIPVWYLGKSIELLSQADIVYFDTDWRNSRLCTIEHEVADKYGIGIIED